MNLSEPFIKRPVATTICVMAIVLFGWIAFKSLPISELPNVDFPTIVVSAKLSGADPENMASTVATPLEKQLSSISGIDSMSSVSTDGSTRITIQFDLSRNIDAAAQDVQTAISEASSGLPKEMTDQPTFWKINPADSPILYLAFSGEHVKMTELDDYAENYVAERLSMVNGVSEVDVYGPQQYAVRIYVNPTALALRGIGLDVLSKAIQEVNTNQPSGTMQMSSRYHVLKTDGQLYNAAEFNNAIITYQNNAPVRLKDVATAIDSIQNDKAATWYNGKRAIVLAISRQPDANTVQVVQDIRAQLPTLLKQLPGGAKLFVTYDRSEFIKASIDDMEYTLLFAALLVGIVMYLFLNSFPSMIITLLALPVSVLGTFAVMYLASYSLDNLSLMGLVLAVGFVIDDAVVVLENIVRHLEEGIPRELATLLGSSEISFTILSMTISLIAVFIPLLFMGGMIGRLFHEFAVVVATVIFLSGVVALTLTPMLCSRFLPTHATHLETKHRFLDFFDHCRVRYEIALRWVVDRPKFVFIPALITLLLTLGLFVWIPKGFIPSEDTGLIRGATQAPEGIPYPDFVQRQEKAATIIQSNPNVEGVVSSVGQGAGGVANTTTGRFTIRLKPAAQRSLDADQVIAQLRRQLSQIPGLKVYLQNPPMISIGAVASPSNYQYVLQGMNWTDLINASEKLQNELQKNKNILDLNSDLQLNNPEIDIHLLRDQVAAVGLTPDGIENFLYLAYGASEISEIMTADSQYQVIIEVDPKYQASLSDLNSLYIPSPNGGSVPLLSVARVSEHAGPLVVSHYGLLPSVTLSFDIPSSVSLSQVTNEINAVAAKTLPSDISGSFIGTAQSFQDTMKTLPLLLLVSILVIYMVLAILYEDFIHPLTILTALPFALFGGLVVLPLFQQQLNLYSFIGLIVLIGLVKKNGIMMVDFAIEAQRNDKLSPKEAIIQACMTRFRPILMTTVAAIAAAIPIAIGLGAGGASRRSLGIAMIGGLLFSQLFTLFVTPLFYLVMEKVSNKVRGQKH
ncbi:MAG: efflux RND transporter permease subunit [Legionellales bacterium]|nr:efflux RND transporter permease subunit [Legionellales bacterium]